MSRTLTRDEARRVYDRIGAFQDRQGFYEDPATRLLLRHGAFERARRVFELGCGTGRLAETLLEEHLADTATYVGVDLSPVMVDLARRRLARFESRAEVRLTDGSPPEGEAPGSYDRFVTTYVFDLLSEDDIRAMIAAAHRMLGPGGLLCAAGLGEGAGRASRLVARAWGAVQSRVPRWVGGCRPVDVGGLLEDGWRVVHHSHVAPFAVPSEVLVAARV